MKATTDPGFDPILTENLILRAVEPGDAVALFAYRSDPEIARLQGFHPMSLAEVQALIDRRHQTRPNQPGKAFMIAIEFRETGRVIGDCVLVFPEFRDWQVEVGINISREFQGRGLGTESMQALLNYLFIDLSKHRVYAITDPRNLPSQALWNTLGFRQEAHLIESTWLKGEWVDDIIFAILQKEWLAKNDRIEP